MNPDAQQEQAVENPRTDAAIKKARAKIPGENGRNVCQDFDSLIEDFVRPLERENIALRGERERIAKVFRDLYAEYLDRKCQWGDEYLWSKHEHKPAIEAAEELVASLEGLGLKEESTPAPVSKQPSLHNSPDHPQP